MRRSTGALAKSMLQLTKLSLTLGLSQLNTKTLDFTLRMDEDLHHKEVYVYFGLAIYQAQSSIC
jgi:hypothetical protein